MGNICNTGDHNNKHQTTQKRLPYRRSSSVPSSRSSSINGTTNKCSRMRSSKRENDNEVLHEQALAAAAAIILGQQQNGSLPFDRSTSLRYPPFSKKQQQHNLPRSSSSRARSSTDALLHPNQLRNQELKHDVLPACHFVLVHGGGFGAWCWYKTIALLEESDYKVTAIDLAGSGIHSFDTNGITSLSQYVMPLTEFLEKLGDEEKVILVGHDFGGSCISYSMELFPSKVSKAVYVAALMLTDGQSALDILSQQVDSLDLLQQAQKFQYANGNNHPPTSIDLEKSLLKELLFNQSPTKDIALASVSMRPVPFAPVLEKLSLSSNYGSVRRFYIETTEDNAIPTTIQEQMMKTSPPEQVFRIKGADHSPFFSKPQALYKYLVEISKIR
ncbi:putative methylesterase 11, chloroplastic [Silene latifolia]|uniref:putative methylesterase 11, chloroplastic n=1 Tax=Silene latifolia TaxID=37657 RepID=UPI003D7799A6